jgi:hypothetical protein
MATREQRVAAFVAYIWNGHEGAAFNGIEHEVILGHLALGYALQED